MKNAIKVLLTVAFLLVTGALTAQDNNDAQKGVLGYWWMYDLGAKNPSGLIYIYEYQGQVYGRTVFAYNDPKNPSAGIDTYVNPVGKSQFIAGNPFTVGMDVLWGLTWSDAKERYVKGYILDPRKKSPYQAEIWLKNDPNQLNMKGILPGTVLGGSVTWKRAGTADLPEGVPPMPNNLVPKIYY